MKRKFPQALAYLLAFSLLICPALAASSFPDVDEDAEYAEAVEYLKDVGIMVGDDRGNFNPNSIVTRGQMATIICKMLGETDGIEKTEGVFTDVPKSHWASGYIARAASLQIISGYGDGKFGPNDAVTYEQAVTMIVRAIGGWDEAINRGGYPNGFLLVAEEAELLFGVHAEIGEALSRADIAMIVYAHCCNIAVQ